MLMALFGATGTTAGTPFATIALLAGGIVGALLRVVLERLLVAAGGRRSVWRWELGLAAALGVALALPLIASLHALVWAGSSLGGALTAYPAACAAYGFVRARGAGVNPLPRALAHFLGPTLVSTLGLVAVVIVWRMAG